MNAKQQIFVAEYLKDRNATQAAIRAGYKKRTAKQIGSKLLTRVDVSAAVAEKTNKRLQKLEVTAESVLNGIVETTNDAKLEGQLNVALKGYELLGKHLKLFGAGDAQPVNVNVSVITDARDKLRAKLAGR